MEQTKTRKRRKTEKPQRAIRAILYLEDQSRCGSDWETTGIQKMDLGTVIWDFNTENNFKRLKMRSIATELLPVFVEMINSRSQELSACITGAVDCPGWMNRAIPE